ncbi:MAG: hypothetical protein F4Z25_00040 [Chloroflexi bacterium]|nr:hypothetical protein [Chloroflexota bacterium]
MPSVRLPEYELADLFGALGVWRCLDEGSVEQRVEPSHPARLCALPGAVSYYVRLLEGRREWARVHYVECPIAGVIGRWPSALKVGDVTLYRIGHQARPSLA